MFSFKKLQEWLNTLVEIEPENFVTRKTIITQWSSYLLTLTIAIVFTSILFLKGRYVFAAFLLFPTTILILIPFKRRVLERKANEFITATILRRMNKKRKKKY